MADLERRRGYHPNHGTTPDEFGRVGLGGYMMDPKKTGKIAIKAAKTVALRAKMLVQAEASGSGTLAKAFEVLPTVVVLNENPPNPRLAAIVVNQTRYAARWEFGSAPGHRNAHRSLRKAGASVGDLKGGIG